MARVLEIIALEFGLNGKMRIKLTQREKEIIPKSNYKILTKKSVFKVALDSEDLSFSSGSFSEYTCFNKRLNMVCIEDTVLAYLHNNL